MNFLKGFKGVSIPIRSDLSQLIVINLSRYANVYVIMTLTLIYISCIYAKWGLAVVLFFYFVLWLQTLSSQDCCLDMGISDGNMRTFLFLSNLMIFSIFAFTSFLTALGFGSSISIIHSLIKQAPIAAPQVQQVLPQETVQDQETAITVQQDEQEELIIEEEEQKQPREMRID